MLQPAEPVTGDNDDKQVSNEQIQMSFRIDERIEEIIEFFSLYINKVSNAIMKAESLTSQYNQEARNQVFDGFDDFCKGLIQERDRDFFIKIARAQEHLASAQVESIEPYVYDLEEELMVMVASLKEECKSLSLGWPEFITNFMRRMRDIRSRLGEVKGYKTDIDDNKREILYGVFESIYNEFLEINKQIICGEYPGYNDCISIINNEKKRRWKYSIKFLVLSSIISGVIGAVIGYFLGLL